MKRSIPTWFRTTVMTLGVGLVVALIIGSLTRPEFWFSKDQQAQRLLSKGAFTEAAGVARDPMISGTAWYRAKDFKKAAEFFALSGSPEAWFNLGNAQIFQGQYEAAIKSYDTALSLKPDWLEAEQNRQLASLRADAVKAEGGDMGDQRIGADKIVFDKKKGKSSDGQDTDVQGNKASDQQIQALWLRRLDTRPADFLKFKFAYQASENESR